MIGARTLGVSPIIPKASRAGVRAGPTVGPLERFSGVPATERPGVAPGVAPEQETSLSQCSLRFMPFSKVLWEEIFKTLHPLQDEGFLCNDLIAAVCVVTSCALREAQNLKTSENHTDMIAEIGHNQAIFYSNSSKKRIDVQSRL